MSEMAGYILVYEFLPDISLENQSRKWNAALYIFIYTWDPLRRDSIDYYEL